jgi:hypothetical protein
MKLGLASATALCFALTQVAVAPAMAEAPSAFRTAPAQSFTQSDLERFGLSASDAAQVHAYQQAGYQVQVLSADEAQSYRAGQYTHDTMWIVIGAIVLVVLVAAAVD